MPRAATLKVLEAQVAEIQERIAALEAKREGILDDAAAIEDELAALRGTRGPGRPRGRKARTPRRRGPGRPPGRRAKSGGRRGPRKTGLTDFVRAKVARKRMPVLRLAKLAARAGYKSANLPQVIRLMVGKAADLKRNPDDTIQAKRGPGRPKGAVRRRRGPRSRSAVRPRKQGRGAAKKRPARQAALAPTQRPETEGAAAPPTPQ